jgi:hypothetical protein
MARTMSLIVRNLVFTVVVAGLGGAWVPWWILPLALLVYAGAMAVVFHLFVIGYEEPMTMSLPEGQLHLPIAPGQVFIGVALLATV